MEKLIQIKNLTKCFGETKVLDKSKRSIGGTLVDLPIFLDN